MSEKQIAESFLAEACGILVRTQWGVYAQMIKLMGEKMDGGVFACTGFLARTVFYSVSFIFMRTNDFPLQQLRTKHKHI